MSGMESIMKDFFVIPMRFYEVKLGLWHFSLFSKEARGLIYWDFAGE